MIFQENKQLLLQCKYLKLNIELLANYNNSYDEQCNFIKFIANMELETKEGIDKLFKKE